MSVVGAAVTYAAIGGGAALIGGLLGSDASRSAANTQADASRAATQAQLQMFGTVNQQQLPYRQSGYNALNALNFGLGLPTGSYDGNGFPGGSHAAAPAASTAAMPNIGGTVRLSDVGGTGFGGVAGAMPTAPTATQPAGIRFGDPGLTFGGQQRGSNQGGPGAAGPLMPGPQAAPAAAPAANQDAASPTAPYAPPGGMSGGQFTHQFNASDLNANLAPNYQFQLDQGLGAVRNAGNLSTGLVSGNTLKGINDYAQNYAGGAYQQAYNNYNQNQTNIFNRLSSIAGLGQTANQSTGQAATATGQGIASSIQNTGAAQASGAVGQANAISGAVNNAAGWYALSKMPGMGGNV